MEEPQSSRGQAWPGAAAPSGAAGTGAWRGTDSRQELESGLLEARTLRDYLDDFAMRAGRHLGLGTEVSITLRHAGRDRLAASSSDRAARCDQVEYVTGVGPCLTAMDSMRVVLVPDVTTEDRWPAWTAAATDAGYRSSAGLPAHVGEGVEIALNLYSEKVDAWDRSLLLAADTYAQQVAMTVGLALQVAHLADARDDAEGALRDLRNANRLLLTALARDEASPGELAARLRSVVRGGTTDPEADVRAVIEAVTGTSADDESG